MNLKHLIIPTLLLTSCSTPRAVEQRRELERRDTLSALFSEDLVVRFDDLRIIPPDSLRPRIKAAAATVGRRRQTSVIQATEVEETTQQQPVNPPGSDRRLWLYVLVGVIGFLIGRGKWR